VDHEGYVGHQEGAREQRISHYLQTLFCDLYGMHRPTLKNEEVIEFQKMLSDTPRKIVIGCALSTAVHLKPLRDRISTAVKNMNHC
jgi:hypothetical protein